MKLSVLYRGSLTSCNYACQYCPFSKRFESKSQLEHNQVSLDRFVNRLGCESSHSWRVLFTPWGEALVREWYRHAIIELTHIAQVESVCAQTNLSADLEWINHCSAEKLALWATYHPTETSRERFLSQVQQVVSRGVRISVGMVGAPDFINEIQEMRHSLPDDVYLWINPQQPRPRPYTEAELALFATVDPHFMLTYRRRYSFGAACRTGEVSFTVNGKGDMRRCHFVDDAIGNFYCDDWETALRPRLCPNRFCDCFLGKSQLKVDEFVPVFGAGLTERLPLSMG
jgi:MoaA/NifB/PqqE/SkfB family radical SAM enzyme